MKHIILGAAALILSAAAHAETYIGGAIGASSIDCNVSGCDGGDTGFKLYGGYVLPGAPLPGLSLEVGYIDFGKATAAASIWPVNASYTVQASAMTFAAALRAKFTPALSGVGRLGLAYVEGKSTGSVGVLPISYVGSQSKSEMNFYGGLGLEYTLNKQFKLVGSADFTSYDTGRDSGSARLLSIGAQYGF
jgi:hypothetical protein